MAIISELEDHKDDHTEWVYLDDYNSSDYDEFLSNAEVVDTATFNYEIPPPPPGVTVTVHMDDEHKKIRNQKRSMRRRLATDRRQ